MRPYTQYKDSSVQWLGDIPDHWEVTRLKFIGESIIGITYNPTETTENGGVLVLRASNIQNGKIAFKDCVHIDKPIPEKLTTHIGDILICSRSGSRELIGKNIVIDESVKGVTFGAFMTIFRTKQYGFISKYFNSQVFKGQSGLFLTSTINQLTVGTLNNFSVALPPENEQQQIASYLDHKTNQIDTLIEKKKQLIDLLKEERTSVINEAVTKGLDANVKMKDSGIEWLGEIPEHWNAVRAKAIFYEVKDRSETGDEELLTVSHLTGVTKRSDKNVNMFMAESLEGYKVCKEGDLVINTMWAWMGALGTTPFDGIVSPSYNVYRFRNLNQNSKYYDVLFRTPNFIFEINRFSKGVWSSRLRLYPTEFFEIQLPLIPLEEQNNIVDHIEIETSRIDTIISKSEKEIELLQEYRTALISEVVTGKIDVRDWKEPEK